MSLLDNSDARSLEPVLNGALSAVGALADHLAARGAVADYLARKSANTIRTQAASLDRFAAYLDAVGEAMGQNLSAGVVNFAAALRQFPAGESPDITAWAGLSWGLIEGFRNWMVSQGDAVSSINLRLSAVKVYAKLAAKAGVISAEQHGLIRLVAGYTPQEGKRVDERRPKARRGPKKARHVAITPQQARQLKDQPATPQGRRDALLMALLLDHGLRAGEVERLQVSDFDLSAGEMRFYRPKVDKAQTHKLSADTLRALQSWLEGDDAPRTGSLLCGSRKGGALTDTPMSAWAISQRVRTLGERMGIAGLSAHDCRHYWATHWAGKVDLLRLQEAGGWSSLNMPRRYVDASAIANEGMV